MTPTEYAEYVDSLFWTEAPYDILAAAMGLGGEAGEVVDEVKKIAFHDHQLHELDQMSQDRRENLVLELGDTFFYAFALTKALGLTFEDVVSLNKRKLDQRHGGN